MARSRRSLILVTSLALLLVPSLASADHSWGSYHWARTSNPFTLTIHDNVDSRWDSYFVEAASSTGYWNNSKYLRTQINGSALSNPKRCTSATGRIEVCNERYGRTGWLGVAGIWASGSHITKAYTKLNDTYFDTATYNKPEWRRMVMCQEIGHDFGLDHQDENFNNANLGTCMDYTNNPLATPNNMYPNKHDYDQLDLIYQHTDNTTTISSVFDVMTQMALRPPTLDEIMADAGQWGMPVRFDGAGKPNVFVLPIGVNHAGEHEVMLTHVLWAPIDPFERENVQERGPRH
jgi:hypothetical protein